MTENTLNLAIELKAQLQQARTRKTKIRNWLDKFEAQDPKPDGYRDASNMCRIIRIETEDPEITLALVKQAEDLYELKILNLLQQLEQL